MAVVSQERFPAGLSSIRLTLHSMHLSSITPILDKLLCQAGHSPTGHFVRHYTHSQVTLSSITCTLTHRSLCPALHLSRSHCQALHLPTGHFVHHYTYPQVTLSTIILTHRSLRPALPSLTGHFVQHYIYTHPHVTLSSITLTHRSLCPALHSPTGFSDQPLVASSRHPLQ